METQSVLVSDPLSRFDGPLLFPATIRASLNDKHNASLPHVASNLQSVDNFMKSLKEQRSPEKLRNDAKRIVDGGVDHLESSLVGNAAAIAAKVKEMPQERRPGLNLTRKKRPFTLRTNSSQQSLNLEPVLNIDEIEDPDAYFDACAKNDKAKKEIQRLMGGSTEKLDILNLPARPYVRRPGILGKTYDKKPRYSIPNFENDGPTIIIQEKEDHIASSARNSENSDPVIISQENDDPAIISQENNDPQWKSIDYDHDLDEVELAASAKKTGNHYADILEDLLGRPEEDLDGDGALNLLQEKLNIKPLDMESLKAPEFHGIGRFRILSPGDGSRKSRKSSHVIERALKHVNKSPMGNEQVAQNPVNPVSSPTPPRSPFASLNSLKKNILQPNPLNAQFSFDLDISDSENDPTVQPIGKLQEQVGAEANLSMYSSELNPSVEVENAEKTYHIDEQKGIESGSDIQEQFVDENASVHRENAEKKQNGVSAYSIEETMSSKELSVSKNSSKKVMVGEDGLRDNYVAGNESLVHEDGHNILNNIPDHSIEGTINLESQDPNLSIVQDVDMSRPSTRAGTQPMVSQADRQKVREKVVKKRTRNARPMRKSIADYGTTFDNGVRRSKRIKMRPLEYWKGERFLYGVMNDSVKLIGVKYISPEKDAANLKVKPYIPAESSEYKSLLDLAARH